MLKNPICMVNNVVKSIKGINGQVFLEYVTTQLRCQSTQCGRIFIHTCNHLVMNTVCIMYLFVLP